LDLVGHFRTLYHDERNLEHQVHGKDLSFRTRRSLVWSEGALPAIARKIHFSIIPICRRTSFTFILKLQPVSSLIRPNDASSLHSVRCLVFPVVNYTSLKVFFQNFPPACTSWGFLTGVVLYGKGVSLTPNQRLVDQASIFMSPGDREVRLYVGHCQPILTHNSGRVTQICVFNTVKLGTSASSP